MHVMTVYHDSQVVAGLPRGQTVGFKTAKDRLKIRLQNVKSRSAVSWLVQPGLTRFFLHARECVPGSWDKTTQTRATHQPCSSKLPYATQVRALAREKWFETFTASAMQHPSCRDSQQNVAGPLPECSFNALAPEEEENRLSKMHVKQVFVWLRTIWTTLMIPDVADQKIHKSV